VKPSFAPAGVRKTRPWEYAVRFVFGGLVTAATGAIAHRWGPVAGGLFLAFPAILPASLTLVKQHDGRAEAAEHARGACLGTVGLAAFALVAWRLGATWPPVAVLAVATAAWTVVGIAAWTACYGLSRSSAGVRAPSRAAPAKRTAR
jgi:hypothetical protein